MASFPAVDKYSHTLKMSSNTFFEYEMARYSEFGKMLAQLRRDAGFAQQVDLSKRLGVAQQSVSRWENGTSRPRANEMPNLAKALDMDDADALLRAAGYIPSSTALATAAALSPFPLEALGEEAFERFSHHLLSCLYPNAAVHRFGGQGHTQEGIDIEVRMPDGRRATFQCKRHKEFGPAKVRTAVDADLYGADEKILLLSRVATPAARNEISKHATWDIWDKDDISLKIRRHLTPDEQRRIVDTFFPGQRLALIGQMESGPWQTSDEFFAPFKDRQAIFSHAWTLVGREDVVASCLEKLANLETKVVCIVGAGGSGKSRILMELLRRYEVQAPDTHIRLLSPNEEPNSKSLDELGQGSKLLVIDDAHDQGSLPLLFQRVASGDDLKLILCLRPYGISKVQADAGTFALSGNRFAEVVVPPLNVSQATNLASEVLVGLEAAPEVASDIARLTYDCPLATVVSAHLVGTHSVPAGLVANEAEFRKQIFSKFQDVIAGKLGQPSDGELFKKVLKLIALLQPIAADDDGLARIAQAVEAISQPETKRVINLLATGGVLFKRGRRYRLSPDLLADFVIQNACIGLEGLSTGYAESIFACATTEQIKNLLANVSKLDWRLSSNDSSSGRLLDGVWGQLEAKQGDAKSLVDAISAAAFYQPTRTLEYAEQLIREGRTPRELPGLLRNVAYHLPHLRRACECLWELGRKDDRTLGQNPSHGIRLLAELCEVEPNKPLDYCEVVVDFGLSLIPLPASWTGAYTPFDFLAGILKTDGHSTTAKGYSLSFVPFFVEPEAVRSLRAKVIDRAIQLLTFNDLSIAVKAAKFVEGALRYPMGSFGASVNDETRTKWTSEFVETLTKLKRVVEREALTDIVHIEIAKVVGWLAQHGAEEVRELARGVIAKLPRKLESRVAQALMSGWMQIHMDGDLTDSEQRWRKRLEELANELLADGSSAERVLLLIEYHLQAIASAGVATEASPYLLFNLLLSKSSDLAFATVEHTFEHPDSPIARFAGEALAEVLGNRHKSGFAQAKRLWSSGNDVLQRTVARAYSMYQPATQFTAGELRMLQSIFAAEPSICRYGLGAINTVARTNKRGAIGLLKLLPLGTSRELADEAFTILQREEPLPLSSLSDEDVTALLEKLVPSPDLDGYWVQTVLAALSGERPALVLDFFLSRLLFSAKNDDWSYRVCYLRPYQAVALRFKDAPSADACMRRLVEWMRDKGGDASLLSEAGELFASLFGPLDDHVIAVLTNELLTPSPDSIRVLISILAHADNSFVFTHRDTVMRLLDLAMTFDRELADATISSLYRSAVNGVSRSAPGQPSSKDLDMKQEAEKVLSELSRFSIAFRLYDGLRRHAEQSIQMNHAVRGAFDDDEED